MIFRDEESLVTIYFNKIIEQVLKTFPPTIKKKANVFLLKAITFGKENNVDILN